MDAVKVWILMGVMLASAALAGGCVRGKASPLDEDQGCFDDLSCPAGFFCSVDPFDPSSPGECLRADTSQQCSNDDDCFRGEECVNQLCVPAAPSGNNTPGNNTPGNNNPNNTPGNNNPNNTPGNNNPNNTPGNNNPNNMPDACQRDVDCEVFEECCAGVCIERGTCVGDDPCTAQGQPCLLPEGEGLVDQGSFYCVLLNEGDDTGTCLARCTTDLSADNCAPGAYCLDVGADANPLTLCLPSNCNNSAECVGAFETSDGTCVRFDNNAGYCFRAGSSPQGANCNVQSEAPADNCDVDLFCLIQQEGNSVGSCRNTCDIWNNGACPFGQACGLLTSEMGVCDDQTTVGRQPFDECAPAEAWCGARSRCLGVNTNNGEVDLCLTYCRPGQALDCAGVAFQGTPTICETFDDPNALIGLCFPPAP